MIKKMAELNLSNQRVLIREDFNVPMKNGVITDSTRIHACLPTIKQALAANAKIILMSHLGRPEEGQFDAKYSLQPVATALQKMLNIPVRLIANWHTPFTLNAGEVVLLENIRFERGENDNHDTLAQALAHLCDIYVMDAFATAHRAQASTHGVAKFAKIACAGPLLTSELTALARALQQPEHPLLAIVGGSKVSSKLEVLQSLLQKVDALITGGGILNTFIAASGQDIGKSLYEADLIPVAKTILAAAEKKGTAIPLPIDVVVAKEFNEQAAATIKKLVDIKADEMILDIGPETCATYAKQINAAKTIVWNGPVGVFEFSAFATGTKTIANAIAHSAAFSLAGGGDTLAAIDQFGLTDQISYISTGGGAFLEFLEGKTLPAVEILQKRAQ